MGWSMAIDNAIPKPLRVIFRGVGQVFFCCNAITGLIFLIALYIGGVTAGLAATVGVISSTVAAYLLGFLMMISKLGCMVSMVRWSALVCSYSLKIPLKFGFMSC